MSPKRRKDDLCLTDQERRQILKAFAGFNMSKRNGWDPLTNYHDCFDLLHKIKREYTPPEHIELFALLKEEMRKEHHSQYLNVYGVLFILKPRDISEAILAWLCDIKNHSFFVKIIEKRQEMINTGEVS